MPKGSVMGGAYHTQSYKYSLNYTILFQNSTRCY